MIYQRDIELIQLSLAACLVPVDQWIEIAAEVYDDVLRSEYAESPDTYRFFAQREARIWAEDEGDFPDGLLRTAQHFGRDRFINQLTKVSITSRGYDLLRVPGESPGMKRVWFEYMETIKPEGVTVFRRDRV